MHSLNAQMNMTLNLKKKIRAFPDPVVKNLPAIQGTQVRFLVGELKSHMPWSNLVLEPGLLKPAHHN